MSHQPERTEKNCLNCGTDVHGRFCHVCGQENIVTKQSFWGMAKHFVFDLFHFDGKFFDTLRLILTRPGRVAKGYIEGKRMSYLDPIRMYLFTSAVFFLVFFSINEIEPTFEKDYRGTLSKPERLDVARALYRQEHTDPPDTFRQKAIDLLLDSSYSASLLNDTSANADSTIIFNKEKLVLRVSKGEKGFNINSRGSKNWFTRLLERRINKLRQKNPDEPRAVITGLLQTLLHRIPYLLFVSLPFFALILKFIYANHRRFFYTDHLIFTLYHYIFSFFLLFLILGISELQKWLNWGIFGWLIAALVIAGLYYLYKGMRVFYMQDRTKTILKFLVLNFLGFVVLLILSVLFILLSAIF